MLNYTRCAKISCHTTVYSYYQDLLHCLDNLSSRQQSNSLITYKKELKQVRLSTEQSKINIKDSRAAFTQNSQAVRSKESRLKTASLE
jgi:Cft2 family RNA processing exonuclease